MTVLNLQIIGVTLNKALTIQSTSRLWRRTAYTPLRSVSAVGY